MRQLTLLLFLLLSSSLFSQSLKLSDLTLFCGKKSWDEVNNLIRAKGWEYYKSKAGDFDSYNEVVWSYDLDYYDDEAKAWLTLYTYEGLPSKIQYQLSNRKAFQSIESSISAAGFKKVSSDIFDDQVTAEYVNDKYKLTIFYSKLDDDDYYEVSSTAYIITVTKKGTIYDPDNGLKYSFRDDLTIESEYHLKDGELDGQMIEFYPDGSKKTISNWSKGKISGKIVNYDEEGNVSSEYFVANELLNGIRKDYESGILVREVNFKNDEEEGIEKTYYLNGKLKWTINFSNGKRNGIYQEYNMDGLMVRKETYVNDLLIGPFENILFDDEDKPFEIVRGNLVDDKLDGKVVVLSFKEKDTLRVQYYQNGLKSGKWLEYKNKKIAYEYGYKDDQLDGYFAQYFTSGEHVGKIVKECYYKNGSKHGTEKIHFKLFDVLGDYNEPSGSIFLPAKEVINYSNGLKNGSYYNHELEYLHSEGEYLNDMKTGYWIETETGTFWDSSTALILKGNYNMDQREGVWKGYVGDKLYIEFNCKNGRHDGPWQFYNPDGTLGTGYMLKDDKRTEIKQYSENYNFQNFNLLNEDYNSITVEHELKKNGTVQRIHYKLSNQVSFSDNDFLNYFESQTKATTESDTDLHPNKHGIYYFDNSVKQVKGVFANNVKDGNWTTYYKNQGVIQKSFFLSGNRQSETFTDANGYPFTGILTINNTKTILSIKIKDGLRNGPTIETLNGLEISKTKYKKGVLKE